MLSNCNKLGFDFGPRSGLWIEEKIALVNSHRLSCLTKASSSQITFIMKRSLTSIRKKLVFIVVFGVEVCRNQIGAYY